MSKKTASSSYSTQKSSSNDFIFDDDSECKKYNIKKIYR